MADQGVTRDAFYDGRLILIQPAKGHRSGTDAVLLAASVPRDFDGLVVDVGAGVGAVGLGVALACPRARVVLIENDARMAELATANIAGNGLKGRVCTVAADVLTPDLRSHDVFGRADLVLTNPPFHRPERVRVSPDASRRAAHVLPTAASMQDWLAACLRLARPGAALVVIQSGGALADCLVALTGRAGGVVLKCVHPREGAPANRILLRATKGSRAPLGIVAPLVLHAGDAFTPEADLLHKGRAAIGW